MASAVLIDKPTVAYLDPSEHYRPEPVYGKPKNNFRDFSVDNNDPIKERVRMTYLKMHTNQTVDFASQKLSSWTKFDKCKLTMLEALDKLNSLVDESDPDVDIPNVVHAYQTAESIRKMYPDLDWFHLTGLIHDVGKLMALYGEEQWCVVGDTFPLGCAIGDSVVYKDSSFADNPDLKDSRYNTRLGIYDENCGLDKILMSWGHDEYLYRVLINHGCTLPDEALYMIRFHSFYPWHAGGDYKHLTNEKDDKMLEWVHKFNEHDLYTKADSLPDIEALKPYYQSLIDKYIPGKIAW